MSQLVAQQRQIVRSFQIGQRSPLQKDRLAPGRGFHAQWGQRSRLEAYAAEIPLQHPLHQRSGPGRQRHPTRGDTLQSIRRSLGLVRAHRSGAVTALKAPAFLLQKINWG